MIRVHAAAPGISGVQGCRAVLAGGTADGACPHMGSKQGRRTFISSEVEQGWLQLTPHWSHAML